ncbi:MAG: prepilin-type N-terminal cleavage/methylation domain-containing protein [Candidatus Wallbacteria bacterium]|nr:prepilin-type N-terminal cleavage/methylation domain-containing protein [Candidatus Wallbacteria bacterium]
MKELRRGVTLIEILIATAILAAVVIPVATFIIGGMRRTEISKHSAIALALGANIMDSLLSASVPFGSIDPKGTSGDGGVSGGALPKTLPSVANKRPQATFKNTTGGPPAAKLEGILNDRKKNDTRVKVSEEGLEFEVFFFAGVYADDGTKPAIAKELTFCYVPNPYVPPDAVAANHKILGLPASPATKNPIDKLFPYTRVHEARINPPTAITDYFPGWPKPPAGYKPSPGQLKDDIKKAFQEFDTKSQDPVFFASFQDQRDFGRPNGGLIKLVLGLRWNPNTNINQGVGYSKNTRELWLVSFKGDLAQK